MIIFFKICECKEKQVEEQGKRGYFHCAWGKISFSEIGWGKNILFWAYILYTTDIPSSYPIPRWGSPEQAERPAEQT